MTEKPILFSGPMVRAILDGRKTMTRRVLKPQPLAPVRVNGEWYERQGKQLRAYKPGDMLWVREAWRAELSWQTLRPTEIPQEAAIFYEADGTQKDNGLGRKFPGKLRPGIFMPRRASRITLRVTAVRVERLQDISRGDAMGEGCPFPNMAQGDDPRHWFCELWKSINGPTSWDANPWVAAYSFERLPS